MSDDLKESLRLGGRTNQFNHCLREGLLEGRLLPVASAGAALVGGQRVWNDRVPRWPFLYLLVRPDKLGDAAIGADLLGQAERLRARGADSPSLLCRQTGATPLCAPQTPSRQRAACLLPPLIPMPPAPGVSRCATHRVGVFGVDALGVALLRHAVSTTDTETRGQPKRGAFLAGAAFLAGNSRRPNSVRLGRRGQAGGGRVAGADFVSSSAMKSISAWTPSIWKASDWPASGIGCCCCCCCCSPPPPKKPDMCATSVCAGGLSDCHGLCGAGRARRLSAAGLQASLNKPRE